MIASMASLVSVSFSVPQAILKGLQPRKPEKVARSNHAISRTASKVVPCCISNKGVFVNWGNPHHLRVASRSLWQMVTFSSRKMVITGFWVGPDVDDGWGLVEAYIDQIT